MKEKKNNIPQLRFPGFFEDWEQCKFSELYEKNNERNSELIGYDKTISIATMTYKDEGNGASDDSLKTYKVLRVGDLAFEGHTNKEFRYGRFVVNDIGTGIMSPRFSTLRPLKEMPVSFWKHYIHYEPIMRNILVNSTKAGTMMNELVIPDFMKQSIMVPSLEEQKQIGDYLRNLDNLITLHQRKCDYLKEYKKGLLQKMFPQPGETKPQIRFPGFTEDWEQRKLSELLVPSKEKNNNGIFNQDDVLAASLGTELQRKHIFYGLKSTEESVKTYRVVNPSDIIYTKSPIKGSPNGIIRTNKGIPGIVPSLYCVYHCDNSINPSIIQAYFEDKGRLDNYLYPIVNVGARNNVNITDIGFLEGCICIPHSIKEQTRIVDTIDKISHFITLHQLKCDELKEYKKGLLQQMFV